MSVPCNGMEIDSVNKNSDWKITQTREKSLFLKLSIFCCNATVLWFIMSQISSDICDICWFVGCQHFL